MRVLRVAARMPMGIISLLAVVILLAVVFAPGVLSPHDPYAMEPGQRFEPPSLTHPFGTNEMGQDIFSRVIHGTRVSLGLTLMIVLSAGTFGTLVGLVSGYYGGRFDFIVMRITDMFFAFPTFILAMAISAALGPSPRNLVFAISVAWWPSYARLVRGQVLSIREELYVESVRASGASDFRIIFSHVLPNCFAAILVKATTDVAYTLLSVSGLSFAGLGIQPPTVELGRMVAMGRAHVTSFWWYSTFPGLAIFFIATTFSFIGDAIQEALAAYSPGAEVGGEPT